MHTFELSNDNNMNGLISAIHESNDPLVVSEDGAECFIAMKPTVFEHILFGTDELDRTDRVTMRL